MIVFGDFLFGLAFWWVLGCNACLRLTWDEFLVALVLKLEFPEVLGYHGVGFVRFHLLCLQFG